jgi:hypothetical protein
MTNLPVDVPWVSISERVEPYYSRAEEAITVLHRLSLHPEICKRNPVYYSAWKALDRDACEAYELWRAAREGQEAGWKFLCAELRADGIPIDVDAPADPERFRRWGLPALADCVAEDQRMRRYTITQFRLPWLY